MRPSLTADRCAFVSCFGGLAVAHLAVFVGLALLMPNVEARLALFSINFLPWDALYASGLPATRTDGREALGWLWSVLAWCLIYAAAALGLTRLSHGMARLHARRI